MSRRSDQTEYLDSSAVERAGMRFANDMLRRSGDGDIYTTIRQSLEEQLYDGLREGVQRIMSPESMDPEQEGDIYTKPNNMIDVIQSGVFELKDKYNSIYNQINKPAKNENEEDGSALFDRVTNPIINTGRVYQEGNPVNDINNDGKIDSEEISVALNGDLGEKLDIVQQDIEESITAPPAQTPFNTPVSMPVNPLLIKKTMAMDMDMDRMDSIPPVSIYRQSNQVQLVTRGLTGHIQSVNLFNRGHPY